MRSITLPTAISLVMVVAGFLSQAPTSVAEETSRIIAPAVMTHDVHATAPGETSAETIMIQIQIDDDDVDVEGLPAEAARKIKIIRAGSANALNSAAIHRLLNDELGDRKLPPDVIAALHDALNQDNPLAEMNVDVIVHDQGSQPVVLHEFNPSAPNMAHRMRPNQGRRWIEKAPLNETAPLTEKAAACILKSLTKVSTESATRLLREACQAAYPDP